MKLKLLTLLSFFSLLAFSQGPINNFNSAPMSNYEIVNSTLAMDQSTSGANVTWTFNDLTATSTTNFDTYSTPTPGELSDYPGTTSVLTTTTSPSSDVFKVYTAEPASGSVSYTGIEAEGLTLNFNSNNALIETFPVSYNDLNTDTSSGDFSFQSNFGLITGTFTGTINTEVDGYGTLIMNDVGVGPFNGSVTRLKVVQNLELSIANGVVVQTTYNYYTPVGNIVFRTRIVELTSDVYNDTFEVFESLLSSPLSVENNIISEADFTIAENPVNDYLKLITDNNIEIKSISVLDIGGRLVLKTKFENNSLLVDTLESGMYVMTAETTKGLTSRKFVKK